MRTINVWNSERSPDSLEKRADEAIKMMGPGTFRVCWSDIDVIMIRDDLDPIIFADADAEKDYFADLEEAGYSGVVYDVNPNQKFHDFLGEGKTAKDFARLVKDSLITDD